MFTGIVEAVGRIRSLEKSPGITTFTIEGPAWVGDMDIGASVAVNGACLTVIAREEGAFQVEAVAETLQRTNLGRLAPGDRVNLERAARLGDRLDGHLVTGHIDATGTLVSITDARSGKVNDDRETYYLTVMAPAEVMQYVVPKGSIAVDGVSLTVVDCSDDTFRVAIIPHTWGVTTFKHRSPGDVLNLEADIIGKYIHRLLKPYISPLSGGSRREL